MKRHLGLWIISFYCIVVMAQPVYYTIPQQSNIKTLQVIANDLFDAPPLIELGSDQYITISFDELSTDMSWIAYRVVHCDASWRMSQISELDYLDGFNNNPLEQAQPSFNTFTSYYNYRLTLPNDRINFKLSGNYAVLFYKEDQPDKTIATACFSVFERATEIAAAITTNTDIDFNQAHQQLSIRVRWKNIYLSNPASELRLIVSQNNRIDNQVVVTNPTRFSANEAIYDHNRALIFEAGNNYRRAEFVSNRYAGIGVEKIRYFDPFYYVYLTPATLRADQPFYYDRDQNGRFVIRQSEAEDHDTEADYFRVNFTLDHNDPFINGTLHLNGDFTYNRFDDDSQIKYNFETQRYEKMMLLKQGHYNYQYLLLPNGSTKATTALIEGNFYETGNEYLIKAYFRPPGQRYDRLIGYGLIKN